MKEQLALVSLRLIGFLPLRLARFLGCALGFVLKAVSAKPYRVAKLNLAACLPELDEESIQALACQRMLHLGQTLFETPGLWRQSPVWLASKILSVEGEALIQEALDSDSGTVVLVPHQGNWEVLGLWLADRTQTTSLYQPPKMRNLENMIKSARQSTGAKLVPTNTRGVAALIKALRRGETTAILPDQQPATNGGSFAPLFGIQALTVTLPYNLLKRSTSRVVFGCALREAGGWRLHFIDPAQQIYSTDQAASLEAMNSGIEAIAALAPEQYQWEYKRFRARPEGSPAIYPNGI